MINTSAKAVVTLLLLVGFSGCGGGGGGAAPAPTVPVASTLSFPLQSAYKSMVASGFNKTFTYTVTSTIYSNQNCSGTGSLAVSAANTPATFNSITGFSAAETIVYIGCPYWASFIPTGTTTLYYDSNYTPTGSSNIGSYPTTPAFPASVIVGNAGNFGTETNSLTGSNTNTNVLSYLVEADTANSAIVNVIGIHTLGFFAISTKQQRYRITQTGALIPISIDTQYNSGYSIAAPNVQITFN